MLLAAHRLQVARPMKGSIVSRSAGTLACACACACSDGSLHALGTVASDRSTGRTSTTVGPPATDAAIVSTPPLSNASICSRGMPRNGAEVWRQSFGENDALTLSSVASDPDGAAFIAWAGGETFKVAPGGGIAWSKSFGSLVATDRHGNAYVAGTFAGTLDLQTCTLVANSGSDVYVVKLDTSGAILDCTALGGEGEDTVTGLAVGPDGNPVVSALGLGTVKLSAGRPLWTSELAGHVAVDSQGSVLVTGALTGRVVLRSERLESAGGEDIFVIKLDADGDYVFGLRFGDAGLAQHGDAVTIDPWDNVFVSGVFDGSVDFGGGVLTVSTRSCPAETWCEQAGFVAKFDSAGRHLWSRTRTPVRSLSGIASDSHGNVLVSGAYPGNVPPYRLPLLIEFDSAGNDVVRSERLETGSSTDAGVGHGVAFDPCDNALWSLSLPPAPNANARSFLAKLAPTP